MSIHKSASLLSRRLGWWAGWRYVILLSCTACAIRTASRHTNASPPAPTCALAVSPQPFVLMVPELQPAFDAFDQQQGAPYAALYVQIAAGRGITCKRLLQRTPQQFMVYTYREQRVDSAVLNSAALATSFAHFATGTFIDNCQRTGTDPVEDYFFMKERNTVKCRLQVSRSAARHFTPLDEARLAPYWDVVQRLANY